MTAAIAGAIADNLARVRDRIERAARAAGMDAASVRLIAVSKTKPASLIREAYAAGQRDFGENYVQELLAKHEELGDLAGIAWHAIGHLQTNKAKDVAKACSVVHSLDSTKLAGELSKRAEALGKVLDVLIQVNVGGEAQKSGCEPDAVPGILDAARGASGLRVRGLMTVPPATDDAGEARRYFEMLVALRDAHGGKGALPELSMGMTHDLEIAVACGATMVRVGSAIFGERSVA